MNRRRLLLILAFAATLLALYFAPAKDEAVVQATTRPTASSDASSRQVRGGAPAHAVDVLAMRPRDDLDGEDSSLFAALSWESPVIKVETPAPAAFEPAAPQAPPAPLRLLGRYQEGGRTAMFATFNDDSVVLWPGEKISAEWRVDAIEAQQIVLTYLPLGQKQSLPWTAAP